MSAAAPDSGIVSFRHAIESDAPAIVEIENNSFAHPGERFALQRVRHLTINPRAIVLVAEQDGRVLGWVAGFVWLRGKMPWGRVYAVAVDPQARGQKLGLRLMEQMIGCFEQRGTVQIFLEVRSDNHAALRLYEKLGFAPCRTLDDYYAPGLTAIRMVRA